MDTLFHLPMCSLCCSTSSVQRPPTTRYVRRAGSDTHITACRWMEGRVWYHLHYPRHRHRHQMVCSLFSVRRSMMGSPLLPLLPPLPPPPRPPPPPPPPPSPSLPPLVPPLLLLLLLLLLS